MPACVTQELTFCWMGKKVKYINTSISHKIMNEE